MAIESDKPPGEAVADAGAAEAAAAPNAGAGQEAQISTSHRVAISLVSNWIRAAVQVGTGFFLLAYMLDRLDEERYGIFRLALVTAQVIAWLSFGMSGAVLRLGSQSVAAKEWDRLSNILSVARTFLMVGAAIGMLGVFVASFTLLGWLKVPESYRAEAAVLAQLLGFVAATHLVRIVYFGALLSKLRYDLVNGLLVVEMLVHTAFVVVCFESGYVYLEVIGIGRAGAALLVMIAIALLLKWVLPEARMSFRRFDLTTVRDVFRFGAWATVSMTTRGAQDAAGMPIVSTTMGVAEVTQFSVPLSFAQYLEQIVAALTASFWPVAAKYAVQKDRAGMARLYDVGTRFSTILLMPSVVALVVYGDVVIRCLKPGLESGYPLLLVCLGLFAARYFGLSAEHIIWGGGRVRWVALSQLIASTVGILSAGAVAYWTDWGLIGVTAALFGPTALRGLVFLPLRMRQEAGIAYRTTVMRCLVPPLLVAVPVALVGWGVRWLLPPTGLFQTLAEMALCGLCYMGAAWFFVLTRDDRRLALEALRRGRPKTRGAATADPRP